MLEKKEIIKWIYELVFEEITKKMKFKNKDETYLKIKNSFFNYYDEVWQRTSNYLLLFWFWEMIDMKWTYKKKNKKEETIPFYIHQLWIWQALYLHNYSFSLRSKKNNRPIFPNYWMINRWNIEWLMNSCKTFLYNQRIPFKQRSWWVVWRVLRMVFLWKDEELRSQEKIMWEIFQKFKTHLFKVKIKDFYKVPKKELLDLYNCDDLLKEFSKENKDDVFNFVWNKKFEKLKDLNILIESENILNLVVKYLKESEINFEIEIQDWKQLFSEEILNYLYNFVYFKERILFHSKINKFKVTEAYELKNFNSLDLEIIEFLKIVKEKNNKLFKKYIKFIWEWFDFKYWEFVFNCFLTQPDLSNSIELPQDVYQWILRKDWIQFDDMYFVKMFNPQILRIKKKFKENVWIKNLSFFWIQTINE